MDNFGKIFDLQGKKIIGQARRNLSNNKRGRFRRINASKRLYNSIKHRVLKNGIAFYFEEYGIMVDRGITGTRGKAMPGNYASVFNPRTRIRSRPPVPSIKRWIRHKGLATMSGGQDNRLAYNIAEKIKREGLQPKLFFTDAFNVRSSYLQEAVNQEVQRLIEEAMKEA